MVELLFERGKLRELQDDDLEDLARMSEEEDVLRYFFSSGVRDCSLYWEVKLNEQYMWQGEVSDERNVYVFSIECEEHVTGCLVLERMVSEEVKKPRQLDDYDVCSFISDRKERFITGMILLS